MAGGVSRGLGGALTAVGAIVLILGLVLLVRGAITLDGESRETLPDEDGAVVGATDGGMGLVALGASLLILFIGIPLLTWGLHREPDPQTGRARTQKGGALIAWATCFLLLGAILVAIGAVMDDYGGAVSRSSGSPFLGESRQEAGLVIAVIGQGAVFVGVSGMALGVVLAGAAWGRARAAGAALFSGSPGMRVFAGVAGFVVVGLLVFALFGAQTAASRLDTAAEAQTYHQAWSGNLSAVSTPFGHVGPGEAVHTMPRPGGVTRALVAATAYWASPDNVPPADLLLIVEVQQPDGSWREVARDQGASGLRVGPPEAIPLPGDVRARLSVPEGSATAAAYVLEIDLRPMP